MKAIIVGILTLVSFSALAECTSSIQLNTIQVVSTSDRGFYKNQGEYLLSAYTSDQASLGQVPLLVSDEEIGNKVKIQKQKATIDVDTNYKVQFDLSDAGDVQSSATLNLDTLVYVPESGKLVSRGNILNFRSVGFNREVEFNVVKECEE